MKPTAEELAKKASAQPAPATQPTAVQPAEPVAVSAESVQLDFSKVKIEPLFAEYGRF